MLFLAVVPLSAAELELLPLPASEGGPWRLQAERVEYQTQTRTYEAWGRVEIRQGERRLQADYIKVNAATKIATLAGKVVLVLGEDILTGESGSINLATRSGEIQQARLFLRRNHFHINGALIRKTGDDTYYAENCVVTTCDADRPAWSFASRTLTVKVDGYATGRGTSLRLGGVPVLYLPATVLPVKTSRQSGFLLPNYSQHRASGSVVELPFYWAINRHMDLTLYQMFANRQGYLQGAEYRYAARGSSGGFFRFSYIRDHKDFAPALDRYWGVAMLNQQLPLGLTLRGNLDLPSDSQYLYDFNYGYLGLDRLSRTLADEFGRNLEQFEVKTRVSSLVAGREFSWGAVNFFGRYYKALTPVAGQPFNKAPSFQLATLPLPLGPLPVNLLVEQAYTHYYRDYGLSGQRLDFRPRLTSALNLGGWLHLEAAGGWRGTGYRVDSRDGSEDLGRYVGRSLYEVKTGLSSVFYRDWGGREPEGRVLRHLLEPRITYYNYAPFNPARIPHFDPFDYGWQTQVTRNYPILDGTEPIGGVNALTYSLTNHFLRRTVSGNGLRQIDDLLWLRLSHSVFFNSLSYGLDGTPIPHRRWSDVFMESRFFPASYLALGVDVGISPSRDGFSRLDLSLLLHDQSFRNVINIDYSYLKNYANQINTEIYFDLFRSFKFGISNQHTFVAGKRLENKYGLIFQRQCWGLRLNFADRDYDRYVSFSIIIPGLLEKRPAPLDRQPPPS